MGHVGRSLVIARALRSHTATVKVTFLCISPGYGERLITGEFPIQCLEYKGKGDAQFADNLEDIIRLLNPDLICLDLTPVPWIYQVRFPDVPQIYITNIFLTKLGRIETVQDNWFRVYGKPCNARRVIRGLPSLIDVRELYERHKVFLTDPDSLLRLNTQLLPENYIPIGACIWEPNADFSDPEIQLAPRFVYVSTGSTGSKAIPQRMLENLSASLGVKRIVWVGEHSVHKKYSGSGIKYEAYKSLVASRVLPSAAAAITQGGAGSTYQALAYGVPVAVWPTHQNHIVMGRYLTEAGIGIMLDNDPMHNQEWDFDSIDRLVLGKGIVSSLGNAPNLAAENILELVG